MSPQETYLVAPSIALGEMAWNLSNSRAFIPYQRPFQPLSRASVFQCDDGLYPISREYYAIIDRISRGEQP